MREKGLGFASVFTQLGENWFVLTSETGQSGYSEKMS